MSDNAGLEISKYFQDEKLAAFVRDIQREKLKSVQIAISEGIDVNSAGVGGARPLHFVFKNEEAKVLEELLKAGADPNIPTPSKDLPLHYAVLRDKTDMLEVLFKYKADPHLKGESGKPALFSALSSNNISHILKLFKDQGVDLNQNWGGETLLTASMVRQDWNSTVALLKIGADPDQMSPRGETPANVFCDLLKRMRPGPPSGDKIYETGKFLGPTRISVECQEQLKAFL